MYSRKDKDKGVGFVQFSAVSEQLTDVTLSEKTGLSLLLQVRNKQCLQRGGSSLFLGHYANDCFDWLISGQQSINSSREATSILSGKCKRFTFVLPVSKAQNWKNPRFLSFRNFTPKHNLI